MTLGLLFDEPQGPVSERHRAFFFGSCRLKRLIPIEFGLVAEMPRLPAKAGRRSEAPQTRIRAPPGPLCAPGARTTRPVGLTARIAGFQSADEGSIPSRGTNNR